MGRVGRPVSVNKSEIILNCFKKYDECHLKKYSFNEIIRWSGTSKASIYRLFGDEDNLQYNIFKNYFNCEIKKILLKINKTNNFKKVLYELLKVYINGSSTNCFYHKNRLSKNCFGYRTKKYITQLDNKFLKAWVASIKRYNKSNELKFINPYSAGLFVTSQITLLSMLKQSKTSLKEMKLIVSQVKEVFDKTARKKIL